MRKLMMNSAVAGMAAVLLVAGLASAQGEKQEANTTQQTGRRQGQREGQGRRSGRAGAEPDEKELRTLVPKIVAAWESFDLDKVGQHYAADADLTYFDLAPMKYDNWAEYREGVKKMFFESNQSGKFKINDDLRVQTRGRLAWATFTFGVDMVSKQGANSHLDGRWTMVLEKRGAGWIVVHEHVSVPMAGA